MEAQQIGNYISIAWLTIISVAAIVVFFHFYYNFRIQKIERENQIKSFKAVIEEAEKQKKRIAQNLHDQVITTLSVAGQNIQDYLLSSGNEKVELKNLKAATTMINRSISDIRAITLELIPKTFSDFGLVKALELYINQLNDLEHIDIVIENKIIPADNMPIPENDQLNLYRICLEILNNLQKHSEYSYLGITIEYKGKSLIFTFEHDGKGTTNDEIENYRKSTKGLGLDSLKTRTMLLNAKIDYQNDVIKLIVPTAI